MTSSLSSNSGDTPNATWHPRSYRCWRAETVPAQDLKTIFKPWERKNGRRAVHRPKEDSRKHEALRPE